MRFATLLALLLIPLTLPVAAWGKDTAYEALRAIGAERDQALLNRVVEVKGRSGTPQPKKWTIVLDDPLARGGVREIEVAEGHIVSERTPVKAYIGSGAGIAMNFQKLNLDSEGAFTVAEEEAKNAKIGFESIDYVLRSSDDPNTAPAWVLQLLDAQERSVGTIRIAADSGAVLSKSFGEGVSDSTQVVTQTEERVEVRTDEGRPHTKGVGHQIDRALHRTGAKFEEFFTGRRTLDRRFRGE